MWTFQLEAGNAGQRQSSILVQAGPSSMRGSLHDGESVRVTGKFKEGVLHANRLFSEDHRASIGPTRTSSVKIVLSLGLLVAFASAFWTVQTFRSGDQSDYERQRAEQRLEFEQSLRQRQEEFDRDVERLLNRRDLTSQQRDAEVERRRQEFERDTQERRKEFDRKAQELRP
jgi:hypothetical protein